MTYTARNTRAPKLLSTQGNEESAASSAGTGTITVTGAGN
jgi:hypothetical protein